MSTKKSDIVGLITCPVVILYVACMLKIKTKVTGGVSGQSLN